MTRVVAISHRSGLTGVDQLGLYVREVMLWIRVAFRCCFGLRFLSMCCLPSIPDFTGFGYVFRLLLFHLFRLLFHQHRETHSRSLLIYIYALIVWPGEWLSFLYVYICRTSYVEAFELFAHGYIDEIPYLSYALRKGDVGGSSHTLKHLMVASPSP